MMARNVGIKTSCVTRSPGRNSRSGRARSRPRELERRIGTREWVRSSVINERRDIVLRGLIVENLTEDTCGVIRRKRRCDCGATDTLHIGTDTGAKGRLHGRVRDLRIRETMLLRVGSRSRHNPRDINDANKRKSRVTVNYRDQETARAVLRKSHHAAGSCKFIAAQVAASRVRERSSICRLFAVSDAVRQPIVIRRRAGRDHGGYQRRSREASRSRSASKHGGQVEYYE